MTTFNDMVEEVLINLEGFTLRQDIIEIDDELIHIDSVDRSDRSAVISPFGRGYRGTTAASHSANAKVTFSPSFPRLSVKRAINDTIRAVYPNVYGKASTTFTFNPSVTTYSLPVEAETVLAVSWEWLPIRRWRHDPTANTGEYATSNAISIYEPIVPGRTINVVYSKTPTPLSNANDVFTTVTGLEETSRDLIIYGAAYRMASFIDPGRLTFTSPEADQNDQTRPFGSGTNTARYLLALYQQRLQEETNRLIGKYPVRVHYTI